MEISHLLIVTIICGALGAHVATTVMKILTVGHKKNMLIGISGGLLCVALLFLIGVPIVSTSTTMPAIINCASAAGIGGGVLMTLVGVLKISFAQNQKGMTPH